jgi:hypothetical protein
MREKHSFIAFFQAFLLVFNWEETIEGWSVTRIKIILQKLFHIPNIAVRMLVGMSIIGESCALKAT